MAISVPISVLKAKARRLRRVEGLKLAAALDRVAQAEGYATWSLLMKHAPQSSASSRRRPLRQSPWHSWRPGELIVLAARRGEGKTVLAVRAMLAAAQRGRKSWFFTADDNITSPMPLYQRAAAGAEVPSELTEFDSTDALSATRIVRRVEPSAQPGSIVVVDYLQALNQRESAPPLRTELEALRRLAHAKGCVMVFTSQLEHSFTLEAPRYPSVHDLKLPSPRELRCFDRACFLHQSRSRQCVLSSTAG